MISTSSPSGAIRSSSKEPSSSHCSANNLEVCNLAPADISKQIPAWSLLTSAYLFRDYDHLKKTFASDVGKDFIKMARDQVGIEVIRPVYFGARQVNLKPTKKINTPADMAGIKLRMPPGEFWQFLGKSIGANPTPVAFAELYTALSDRNGRWSGQSARHRQKHEVLRSDLAICAHQPRNRLRRPVCVQEGMGRTRYRAQAKFRAEADKIFDANAAKYDAQAKEAIEFFKKEGKQVYTPDQNAFRCLRSEEVSGQVRQRLAQGRAGEN